MAHYRETTGKHFVLILSADLWKIDWERAGKVQMSKDGCLPIGFTTHLPIPEKQVRSICARAGLSAERYEQLYAATAAAAVAPPSSSH